MITVSTKKEAMSELLDRISDVLSHLGCNDFTVANTPEMFLAIEEAGAMNIRMTLEEFRNCSDYDIYKPKVSKNGDYIYTHDYIILELVRKELGLK